ncbi:hypothetical protein G6L37_06365 [Agrobacterium rubi]|nr:hypothetical protein [Agrobacterium rubi]NTF24986.1 hypothetical protein [Agrobacterium rubi]
MNDREMLPDETVFIMDYEGRIAEISGGQNRSFPDGYSYTLSDGDTGVNRVGSEGFVDESYDAHPSREHIENILSLN